MAPQDAKVGSVIRATIDFPPAPAGTVGRITGHYFLGYRIHAIAVCWDLPQQDDTQPAIIPRDHLQDLELLASKS
jgi:hypothetical protein